MKKLGIVPLMAMFTVLLYAGSASALPTLYDVLSSDDGSPGIEEPSLKNYLDTGAESLLLTDNDGGQDDAIATLIFEFAGFKNTNTFGIYGFSETNGAVTVNSGGMLEVFNGAASSPISQKISFDVASGLAYLGYDTTTSKNIGVNFGVYLTTQEDGGRTYYSHNFLNEDGFNHALIFDTRYYTSGNPALATSDVVVAFEDLWGGGDQDWNDITVGISDVSPAPVPEPTTMLLLGTGLVGLAGAGRKKFSKKS